MKHVFLFKASATAGKTVEDVTVLIQGHLPDLSIKEGNDLFMEDAKKLADVIFDHLPGGTVDRLVAELMLRRAVSLKVALDPVPETGAAPEVIHG